MDPSCYHNRSERMDGIPGYGLRCAHTRAPAAARRVSNQGSNQDGQPQYVGEQDTAATGGARKATQRLAWPLYPAVPGVLV